MSVMSALGHADALIEQAWSQPITALEETASRQPSGDPLLRAALHTRSHLVVLDNSAIALQNRLHALTRPGYVPGFYELDRLTDTASTLRTVHAEANTALKAIRTLVDARRAAEAERVRAATARTAPSRPPSPAAEQPAPSATGARAPAANRR